MSHSFTERDSESSDLSVNTDNSLLSETYESANDASQQNDIEWREILSDSIRQINSNSSKLN